MNPLFINNISLSLNPTEIAHDLIGNLKEPYDLGIVFISGHTQSTTKEIFELLKSKNFVKTFLGCTSAGIIGTHKEIEHEPASSIILMKLPNTKITPFYINQRQLENLINKEEWYNFLEVYPTEKPSFIVLPDPFRIDMNSFLTQLNIAYPNCPIVGGLASGSNYPNGNTLIINNEQFDEGLIGLILSGGITFETIVSQGCRPIDKTYIVTKAHNNIIYELAGRSFFDVLEEIIKKCSEKDRKLLSEAIFCGIAMDEYKHELKRGDFLIRQIIGIDQEAGAGAITDYIHAGQTIQFHLRDADTATEDLNELLDTHLKKLPLQKPQGALVFSCNGRGEYLFGQKNHDINIIQKYVGPIPAAGFFCAGEIGPIGGKNFLHGFTSSIALFYPKNKV